MFGLDTASVARNMIRQGLQTRLCCVDTQQLAAEFSGRAFDSELLDSLPASCDPCGENGEFHTLVWNGPMFATPVALRRGESLLRDGRFAYTDFVLAQGFPITA